MRNGCVLASMEQPDPRQALKTALLIGGSYLLGGSVPLAPYALGLPVQAAFYLSVGVTSVALLVFGAVKGRFTSVPLVKSRLETFMVGSLAAAAAYLLARLVSGHSVSAVVLTQLARRWRCVCLPLHSLKPTTLDRLNSTPKPVKPCQS